MRRAALLTAAAAAAAVPLGGHDGYGHGIAKLTTSGSDPLRFYAWMAQYLPVHCQDAFTPCNTTFTCGAAGRAALCHDAGCSYPDGPGPGGEFGVHFPNMSARPFGALDNADVEERFTAKLRAAFAAGEYDAFMDFALVLYAPSLAPYAAAFRAGGVPSLTLRWRDDEGAEWHSLLVQVSTSQLVVELVSAAAPPGAAAAVADPLPRLPAAAFRAGGAADTPAGVLTPLAVSRATSDLAAASRFYLYDMAGSLALSASGGGAAVTAFALRGAGAVVRLVERAPNATRGPFLIRDLEAAKRAGHRMAHVDAFCGVDKWYDNHFAYDQNWTTLDAFKRRFDASNRTYHIFGDCKPSTRPGPGTNIYVVDPTGDAVQLDGGWDVCPEGGAGDALQDACSQGNCAAHVAAPRCAARLTALCGAAAGAGAACADCAYAPRRWRDLSGAGCSNADVVNYCT